MSNQTMQITKKINFKFLLIMISCVLFISCNNEKNQQGSAAAPTVKLPIFKWNRTEIETLFGAGRKNPGKMLIKIGHDNYNNHVNTMKLYIYPATDHRHYGADEEGIVVKKDEALGTVDINNNIIIGNNDFDFDKFCSSGSGPNCTLRNFEYAKFIPTTYTGSDGKTHLVFKIVLVLPAAATDQDLGNSNPSPPADPSHN